MSEANEAIPDELIRKRSYLIWEREQRPSGRHLEHWFRAKAELRSEGLQRLIAGHMNPGPGEVYFWDHFG